MVEQTINSKIESRYEFFNKVDLTFLVSRGIASVHLLDWKLFYEKFLIEFKKNKSKYQSYQNVAEDYKVSIDTVKRAVKFMKS